MQLYKKAKSGYIPDISKTKNDQKMFDVYDRFLRKN